MRRRQTPRVRSALGVLVVMWLNLALHPCAMALGDDPNTDCPNCPPAHSQQALEMASKGLADNGMHCAGASTDCEVIDDLNYDGRNAQLKVKDSPDDAPVVLLPYAGLAVHIEPAPRAYLRPVPRHPPAPPQSLNKLYCVYLK